MRYLLFGLHGHHKLVPYIWAAIALDVFAALVFVTPAAAPSTDRAAGRAARRRSSGCGSRRAWAWSSPGSCRRRSGRSSSTRRASPSSACRRRSGRWARSLYTLLLKAAVPIELGTAAHEPRAGARRMRTRESSSDRRDARARGRAGTRCHRRRATVVEPPVAVAASRSPTRRSAGRIRGAPFAVRDARYVVDRRLGYAHTDIVLSSGAAESPCAPVSPRAVDERVAAARRAGQDRADGRCASGPARQSPWSVHYQVFDGDGCGSGSGEGSALVVSARARARRSCSRGDRRVLRGRREELRVGLVRRARRARRRIDQPVRGTPPPEAIPPQYLQRVAGAGSAGH